MQIDKILENHVGSCGRYQILLVAWMSIFGIFGCLYTMEILFTAGKMDYWCEVRQPEEGIYANFTKEEWLDVAIPKVYTNSKWERSHCRKFTANLTDIMENEDPSLNASTTACSKFEYDTSTFKSSIVSEWNLVCSRGYFISLIKSIGMAAFSIGMLVGGLVSDRFGRKRAIVTASVLLVMARIGISLAPSLMIFIFFNAFSIVASSMIFPAICVLKMELVGLKMRGIVGAFGFVAFAIGYLALAGLAYLCRDRKVLHIVNTVPLIIFAPLLWLLPESPRWLAVQGKQKEALHVLEVIARRNGNTLPLDVNVESMNEKPEGEKQPKQLLSKLLRNGKTLLARLCITLLAWLCANLTYFGLTLNIQSFAGSIYVNLAIAGALEFVGSLFGQLIINTRFGRRIPASALYFLSGLSLLLIIAVPSDKKIAATTLAVFGRTCCTAYFAIIYVWTAETFPSSMRTTAVSAASSAGKIGAVISPFLVELNAVGEWLPMVLLGGFSILCGILLMFIPETKGKPLVQTLDDMLDEQEGDSPKV